jgi:hypothetical protein
VPVARVGGGCWWWVLVVGAGGVYWCARAADAHSTLGLPPRAAERRVPPTSLCRPTDLVVAGRMSTGKRDSECTTNKPSDLKKFKSCHLPRIASQHPDASVAEIEEMLEAEWRACADSHGEFVGTIPMVTLVRVSHTQAPLKRLIKGSPTQEHVGLDAGVAIKVLDRSMDVETGRERLAKVIKVPGLSEVCSLEEFAKVLQALSFFDRAAMKTANPGSFELFENIAAFIAICNTRTIAFIKNLVEIPADVYNVLEVADDGNYDWISTNMAFRMFEEWFKSHDSAKKTLKVLSPVVVKHVMTQLAFKDIASTALLAREVHDIRTDKVRLIWRSPVYLDGQSRRVVVIRDSGLHDI